MPSKTVERRARYHTRKDVELLDKLSLVWTYSRRESVTLRRPTTLTSGYTYKVEDSGLQVGRATLNAWEQRGWVECDHHLEGNDDVVDLRLSDEGMAALWGEA